MSSIIGLVTGVGAVGCWLVGLCCPPLIPLLWPIASILGYISFSSFVASLITGGTVIKNVINGRPPSISEIKDLAYDSIAALLSVIGKAFGALRHLFKSDATSKAMRFIKSLFNNGISNSTDALVAKETLTEVHETANDISRAKKFSQTTASTTVGKVTSALLSQTVKDSNSQIKSKYTIEKVEKAEMQLSKSVNQHGFVYAKESSENNEKILEIVPSKHLALESWGSGFFNSFNKVLAPFRKAVDNYLKFDPNTSYIERRNALIKIKKDCSDYLMENRDLSNFIYKKILKLYNAVTEEIYALVDFSGKPNNSSETVDDTVRPMLVGH